MAIKDLLGEAVTVTLPWTTSEITTQRTRRAEQRPVTYQKVVDSGVADSWTEERIQTTTAAVYIRRIRRRVEGQLQDTESVVLGFIDEPPTTVKLGYRAYRTRPYVAEPIQCHRCLCYGHVQAKCRSARRCPRCGELHEFDNCPHRDDPSHAKCIHCGQNHSSKFGGCERRKEVRSIIHTAAEKKLSYADAAKAIRAGKPTETQPMSTRPTTMKTSTARPSTAEMGTQTDVEMSTQTGDTANPASQELKETIMKETEQRISSTFDQMKACMVEMKAAIEIDMDRRDNLYATEEVHFHYMNSLSIHLYNNAAVLMKLHRIGMEETETTLEDFNAQCDIIADQLADLQKFIDYAKKAEDDARTDQKAATSETSTDTENC